MKSWQQAVKDSVVPGIAATVATLPTVALCGRRDTGSGIAPINATSHVLWGNAAARVEGITLRHTLPGLLINAGAGFWWAFVFQKLFGARAERGGLPAALIGGAATAAIAYTLDYRVLPRRLSPGWEERISERSLFMSLAAMGGGIGLGAMLARNRLA